MSPRIVAAVTHSLGKEAAHDLARQLQQAAQGDRLRGVVVYAAVDQDTTRLCMQLSTLLKEAPIIGCTSCLGVGSDHRFVGGAGTAALGLAGEGFKFGSAHAARTSATGAALGKQLAMRALASGGFSESTARFAVLHCTPGDEEQILRGVYDVLDKKTPILGGSAADNDLSGRWRVFTHLGDCNDGAALAVCDWPWKIATAYESGYVAAGPQGIATRVQGRLLLQIDNRPAAEVYNEWTRGLIAPQLTRGGQILAATTLAPLGVPRGGISGLPIYLLVHPESVKHPSRGLSLFGEVREGEKVALMQSTPSALVQRASRVAARAFRDGDLKPGQVLGALLIYCGGCLLAVQDKGGEIMQDFATAVGAPTLAGFTFGEVGSVVPRQMDHGNLMAGVLLLTAERA